MVGAFDRRESILVVVLQGAPVDPELIAATEGFTRLMSGIYACVTAFYIGSSAGLLKLKRWARMLTMTFSFLNLMVLPIGTVIGGYSLWVLSRKDAKELFAIH